MNHRLFQITDTHASGKDRVVPDLFFGNKMQAKAKRRELNGEEKDSHKLRFIVTPGPDHRNYRG